MTRYIKVFILCFFSGSATVCAQTWETGITVGAMGYMGDLNQNNPLALNHPAIGFLLKRNLDSYWSLRLSALQGKISDDESKSKYAQERERNLSFYSPITEGNLLLEFNFFDYGFEYLQKRFTPFLFAGVSITGFNPKTDFGGEIELKYYNTEGQKQYNTITYALPFGAGVKYNFGRYFNVSTEIGYRNTMTDYLDDVSGVYANVPLSDRSANGIGTPGTQRGDFRKKDSYVFVGITLSYTFVSQKCPF